MANWYEDAHAVYERLTRDLATRLPREVVRVRNVAVGSEPGSERRDLTVLEAVILRAGRRQKVVANDTDPDEAYRKLLAACVES
jgi:hypothetical protein